MSIDALSIADSRGMARIAKLCHQRSALAGWWSDPVTGEWLDLTPERFAQKLLLVHAEISEACEGHRKGLMDDHLPDRPMVEVELADAVIRIFDLAGRAGYDITGAVLEKLEYNAQRADHKMENRASEGGKSY